MQKYLTRLYPGILSVIVFAAILWLTLAPQPLPDTEISLFEHADKVVHALMFGGMVFAMVFDVRLWCYRQRKVCDDKKTVLMISIVVSIYGGVVELLQTAMCLGRGGDIVDFFADIIGVVMSVYLSPRVVAWLLRG